MISLTGLQVDFRGRYPANPKPVDRKRVHVSARSGNGGCVIRIDDDANPDAWFEFTLTDEQLREIRRI